MHPISQICYFLCGYKCLHMLGSLQCKLFFFGSMSNKYTDFDSFIFLACLFTISKYLTTRYGKLGQASKKKLKNKLSYHYTN